ncbi:MAG: aquaporin [Saprospiraceae bacterium]
MLNALKNNWQNYFIEAWALGMFMVSACFFVILLEHPQSPIHMKLADPFFRRFLMGLAMGTTAVLLIYSPWGKRSGAHMNPAVTLAFLQMERISAANAVWYILSQFIGGTLGVLFFVWATPDLIMEAGVNYAVTIPGNKGVTMAFVAEFFISFLLLLVVLLMSNSKYADYTGWVAGFLVAIYITFEAPFSGMSINPARTFASAFPSHIWTAWWIYFSAPIGGMMLAGFIYRKVYRWAHNGNCLSMKCHLSGHQHNCNTYEVLGPSELLEITPLQPK